MLEPHLEDDAEERFIIYIQVFDSLEIVYGVVDKEYLYQGEFERLEQGNQDFNIFVAEFYYLSALLYRDSFSLINSFRRKLSPIIKKLIINRTDEIINTLITYYRRLDIDLKIKQQITRRNNQTITTLYPSIFRSIRISANTAVTTQRIFIIPAPSVYLMNPNLFFRSSTPKIGLSVAKRV